MEKPKVARAAKKKLPIGLWGILLLVVILAGYWISQNNGKTAPVSLPEEINVSEAAAKQNQGAFMLDVRQPEEWEQGHISGATLIPLGDLSARLEEVPKDQDVVVVCRSGRRSAEGRNILREAGFTQVTSMAGGMAEWQAQGLPVVSGP